MTKEKNLRKKLAVTAGIMLILIAANISIALFLSSFADTLGMDERKLMTQKRTAEDRHRAFLQQREKAENSLTLYQELAGNEQEGSAFSLDKKVLTRLLNRLNQEYQLKELNLVMSPVREEIGDGFQKKTGNVIVSNIEISFKSITDEFALAFLQELFKEFPGFVNFNTFALARIADINPETLYSARTSEVPMLVNSKVEFNWVGIKINEEAKAQ